MLQRRTLIVGLTLLLSPLFAWAINVAVTALVEPKTPPTPPDTIVVFKGIAYPSSQVTIKRGDEVLVQVPADPLARFDVSLSNQTPGTATYTLSAEDTNGLVGSAMDFTLTLTQGSTVTLTGIFLGPTIQANKSQLQIGDTVTILGMTAPESDVTLLVASDQTRTFETKADDQGVWLKQIVATDIGVGDHTARAKAVTPTAEVSSYSKPVSFSVVAGAPDVCSGKNRADINCDGKVNLQDFSILLYYWKKQSPANVRTDINRDGVVNLTDLSILLFNWTR